MTDLHRTIGIAAGRARVWAELTDFGTMQTWFLGVSSVRVLAAEPEAGAERILRLRWGASHRERFGLWEPEKAFSIEVLEPPFFVRRWTALIRVEGTQERARIDWQMHWESRFGRLGTVLDRLLLRPAIGIALDLSMRRLRRRIELSLEDESAT